MGDIFYIFGLLILVLNVYDFISYFKIIKIHNWATAFMKVNKRSPTKSDYDDETDYNLLVFVGTLGIVEFIWFVFGILSGSWKVFLLLLIFGSAITLLLKMVSKISILGIRNFFIIIIGMSYLLMKNITILALIINHFHFHIDLLNILK